MFDSTDFAIFNHILYGVLLLLNTKIISNLNGYLQDSFKLIYISRYSNKVGLCEGLTLCEVIVLSVVDSSQKTPSGKSGRNIERGAKLTATQKSEFLPFKMTQAQKFDSSFG